MGRAPIRLAGVLLFAVTLVAGCSDSGGGSQSSAPATASSQNSAESTGKAGPSPSAKGTPADPATRRAVAHAYQTFFGYKSTAAQSQAALQHGEKFTKVLQKQGESSYADKSTASVSDVRVSGDLAYLKFTISVNGTPLLSNMAGYAVRTGGTWQVAAKTFCTLLTFEGGAPAQCDDPAITALPGS